ncbi:hypothetical protein GmHk_07G019265 [Glycine max]|nr:hypothetical protein GmHk_07G019265 [Glycine max]
MFVDYVNKTWIIPHKERFVTVWTNKVMHLGNTTTNRVESAHWALKRVLHNSHGDMCSVSDAMNNMITLQHTKIKASFKISTHVVGHVFKKTLYKRFLGMVSRYILNHIAAEFERVHYASKNLSSYGCFMRTTHGLPCAYKLSKYVLDQRLCEAQVVIKEEMETICKRFEELDVYGKVTLKSKLQEIAYHDQNSMYPPPSKVNTKGAPKKPMNRNQRSTKPESKKDHPDDFIDNIVDVKADSNCGYRSIVALLGTGEDSWSLVHNQLLKELGKWSDDYIYLFGGTDRFKELKRSLLVDGLSKVTVDKWMNITEMGYVIASRSQPPTDSSMHRIICIDHVFGNHFVQVVLFLNLCNHLCSFDLILFVHVQQVYLKDCCPLPPLALLWSRNCHPQTKQWSTPYICRMQ